MGSQQPSTIHNDNCSNCPREGPVEQTEAPILAMQNDGCPRTRDSPENIESVTNAPASRVVVVVSS